MITIKLNDVFASHLRDKLLDQRIDVRALRQRRGLSQAEFAGRYALNPRTLQEWEQGRTEPDVAIRAYLTVIDRDPQAVEKALAGGDR